MGRKIREYMVTFDVIEHCEEVVEAKSRQEAIEIATNSYFQDINNILVEEIE